MQRCVRSYKSMDLREAINKVCAKVTELKDVIYIPKKLISKCSKVGKRQLMLSKREENIHWLPKSCYLCEECFIFI